jgi:alpha-glucosidase
MSASTNHFWWQRGVIYQIYPRSFMDSDGDGVGDLAGIIQRLDYLADTLGVDAIWLSPFYPSPMADFGYDVSDYTNVAPVFGDLETFDQLVSQAHQRRLKIIIDFVPNHSSDQHSWFQNSRSARLNPQRDWYIWSDPKPDGSPPNNWLSVFGGTAWEWDQTTNQYYLHSFLKEQPDLNWRNPQVKDAMFAVLRFWLERDVDGFRIDVAHFIMKDPALHDNPLKPSADQTVHKSLGEYDSQLHLHDQGHPDVHRIYRELRLVLDEYNLDRPRVSIGEIHIFDWDKWASYYGSGLDELHMPFNFQLLGVEWQAQQVRKIVDSLEAVIPPDAWPNYVLGNHDESRLASRLGPHGARLAAMLLLTLRGTPTLYYGDEIGMTDVSIPPMKQQDPWGKRVPGLGRDGCRTPMQWDDLPHAGFSPPDTLHSWLPIGEDHLWVNVEYQLQQPDSLLNLYRRLLAYRKESPTLQAGAYFPIEGVPQECFAFQRRMPGCQIINVVLNFSSRELMLDLNASGTGRVILSTYLDRSEIIELTELRLRRNEGIIIEVGED